MAGKSNDEWGCGTFIIAACIIGFITDYWLYIIGVLILIIIILFLIGRSKNKQENVREVPTYSYSLVEKEPMEIKEMSPDGLILSAGKYVATRDIETGIYDVVCVSGYGSLSTDVPEKSNIRFYDTKSQYNNIEISCKTTLKIEQGLKVKLFNRREYIEFGAEDIHKEELAKDIANTDKYVDFDFLDGHEFEYFCAKVLNEQGYQNVEVTRGSGDQGVDVLAEMNGIKYAIQCKRFQSHVGNKAVQEIYSGKKFYHCHVGIIMTNNYFTQSAKDAARELGVILWDRDFLMKFSNRSVESNYIDKEEILTPLLEVNKPQIQILPIDDNICMKKTEEKNMYDVKNGIYPPGQYLVGRDIPLGIYLLKARKDAIGQVDLYANYNDFKEDNNLRYDNFDDDYFLSLNEENLYLVVRSADIKKL